MRPTEEITAALSRKVNGAKPVHVIEPDSFLSDPEVPSIWIRQLGDDGVSRREHATTGRVQVITYGSARPLSEVANARGSVDPRHAHLGEDAGDIVSLRRASQRRSTMPGGVPAVSEVLDIAYHGPRPLVVPSASPTERWAQGLVKAMDLADRRRLGSSTHLLTGEARRVAEIGCVAELEAVEAPTDVEVAQDGSLEREVTIRAALKPEPGTSAEDLAWVAKRTVFGWQGKAVPGAGRIIASGVETENWTREHPAHGTIYVGIKVTARFTFVGRLAEVRV